MKYEIGDKVVYERAKTSSHPGPRARDIHPSIHGENYFYVVDKYWTVSRIIDEHAVEAITRTGKSHQISTDDPRLRKATLLERIKYADRFPTLEEV
ncbi:MAG: hypothetical protein ACOC4C_02035 [Fibrobacterota bacterium]